MKKLVLFMMLVFLLLLVGCRKQTEESANNIYFSGEAVSDDPLHICIDFEYVGSPLSEPQMIISEFLYTLKESGGITDVIVEYLPPEDPLRSAAITRIRAEMMAGEGPDVFIVRCTDGTLANGSSPLFTYPEKMMELGLFLPLDEYMDRSTQFTNWDNQTQIVLSAGRNWEGQQIIPLTYTLPVLCYPRTNIVFQGNKVHTWTDMLTDQKLSKIALPLTDCLTTIETVDVTGFNEIPAETITTMEKEQIIVGQNHLQYILGDLVDYETEELLFSERELTQVLSEIIEQRNQTAIFEKDAFEADIGTCLSTYYHTQDMTLIPLYSIDGGVCACITSFAAVNRNTEKANESFTVIDLLMRDHVQQKFRLYTDALYFYDSISMSETLFTSNTPLGDKHSLSEYTYSEMCKVREQITSVNFQDDFSVILQEALNQCYIDAQKENDWTETVHNTYEKLQRMVRE